MSETENIRNQQNQDSQKNKIQDGQDEQVPNKPEISNDKKSNSEAKQQNLEESKLEAPKNKTIGQYVLGKKLGVGTFGKVKLGTHILTKQPVAIKILEKSKIIDVTDVERVSREIHILKLVRHPHIMQLYEIIETPKHIFLVTEYCSGGELFDYIVKNVRLKESEACKIFQEIIGAIEYIHKLQVVHRDLKPENLLLDENKNIKTVDFGLSNTYKKNELLKTACGSPCYAAPEMIAGKKYESVLVDIWSCGVILFALLCGYLPFEDKNTSQLYKKILNGQYEIPDFVSPKAKDLLKKVLNTDPTTRYNFEDIKKHPWYSVYQRPYPIPPGIIVGYNRIPIDYKILKELQKYEINLDYAQKCIDANKHNNVTTTYHLLLRKHLMEGGKSEADLNSPNFDITLLEPKPRPSKSYYKQAGMNDGQNNKMGENKLIGKSQDYMRIRSSNSMQHNQQHQQINRNQEKSVDNIQNVKQPRNFIIQAQHQQNSILNTSQNQQHLNSQDLQQLQQVQIQQQEQKQQYQQQKNLHLNYQRPQNNVYPKTTMNAGNNNRIKYSHNQNNNNIINTYQTPSQQQQQYNINKNLNDVFDKQLSQASQKSNLNKDQNQYTSQRPDSRSIKKAGQNPYIPGKIGSQQQKRHQRSNTQNYNINGPGSNNNTFAIPYTSKNQQIIPVSRQNRKRENNMSMDYAHGNQNNYYVNGATVKNQKTNSIAGDGVRVNNQVTQGFNNNNYIQQKQDYQNNHPATLMLNQQNIESPVNEINRSLLNATAIYSSKNNTTVHYNQHNSSFNYGGNNYGNSVKGSYSVKANKGMNGLNMSNINYTNNNTNTNNNNNNVNLKGNKGGNQNYKQKYRI
ncbi:Protein kinase-like domain [Pseudocohnilembus persalinus]|uniref:Protein kinase-like domain n=1 Tax=Pseudocohnilembus persalinus TaxID=266149 RepID=A0A0V0QJQ9_PSEPJ|nr:Protein kinase-like domain [Pseudocohnilembus persalinus]|eukprot:KRX02511.1 Protein kinase-like domain [Pseudocohnilembus persalinus]